jgi:hypothetical protein
MEQPVLPLIAAWQTFYVIIGSSAAALTGLQFVVIVLASNLNLLRDATTTRAFATPTIVHFCGVLLLSAILSAPWYSVSSAAFAVGVCGVAGVVYALIVIRHARRQKGYRAVFEDWLWHCALPFIAYAALLVASIEFMVKPSSSLFMIGTAAVLLLFIGIHNAWDSVTYIALHRKQPQDPTSVSQLSIPDKTV